MSRLSMLQPLPIASVAASRGGIAANLLAPDPKEVWVDAGTGAVTLTVDLGRVQSVDSVFLGFVRNAVAATTWSIAGGATMGGQAAIAASSALRVPDVDGTVAEPSHAFWQGSAVAVRYLTLTLTQPGGAVPLSAGVLIVASAFSAELGPEWGSGRRPIDTGVATALPSGGFAVVEGVRKRSYAWVFGDLSIAETERLERIALALGETLPGVVIEDADRGAGMVAGFHYGLFDRWRAFERRNRRQTRWEIGITEWV